MTIELHIYGVTVNAHHLGIEGMLTLSLWDEEPPWTFPYKKFFQCQYSSKRHPLTINLGVRERPFSWSHSIS